MFIPKDVDAKMNKSEKVGLSLLSVCVQVEFLVCQRGYRANKQSRLLDKLATVVPVGSIQEIYFNGLLRLSRWLCPHNLEIRLYC